MPFSEIEETPIIADDGDEFLQKLENVHIHGNNICPTNTLWNIIEALDYTLSEPHVFVITDSTENDYILEPNVVVRAREKEATVRSVPILNRLEIALKPDFFLFVCVQGFVYYNWSL